MAATLTWLDLTASDRDRMRQVLDLFKEQGTVDEMGLGRLRDALSEALFPGTSTIQTRLRYVLFVPWIYRQLEARRIASSSVSAQLRKAEIDLIGPLLENGRSQGVIGERARGSLARQPSSVYWTALVRWGLFLRERPQGWYHVHFTGLLHGRAAEESADDPGIIQARQPNWHPRLPHPPQAFPYEASFDLTREEAVFLQGRIEERCAGTLAGLACPRRIGRSTGRLLLGRQRRNERPCRAQGHDRTRSAVLPPRRGHAAPLQPAARRAATLGTWGR